MSNPAPSRPLGHDGVRETLEGSLPQVTLLRGPKAVGKWALAEHLAEHYGVGPADLRAVEHLSTAEAREIQDFVSTKAAGGHKMVLARLDEASDAALQSLLKTLEEPPPNTSFVLLATGRTLPTVESRSEIYRLGLLDQDQTEAIFRDRHALAPSVAAELAARGAGTAEVPDSIAEERARGAVTSLLKALSDGDDELLNRVIRGWEARAHALLQTWVVEAVSGRWRTFRPGDAPVLLQDPSVARTLLGTLRRDARPVLAVRKAVEPVMAHRRNRAGR